MALTIDVHTHFVPTSFPDGNGRDSKWPSIEHQTDGQAAIMIDGKVYRKVQPRSWDIAARLDDMIHDDIDVQVLSPMPELLSTWFSPEDGDVISTSMNEFVADMIGQKPNAFYGIGMVPIQDPELAAKRLSDVKDLGLLGVEIPTHVNGLPLGDSSLDSFYAEAEANDLVIMVHPLRPIGTPRISGPATLAAAAAFPLDTAMAAISMIGAGVFDKFPNLKVMLSHGGGALSNILGRVDEVDALFPHQTEHLSHPPSHYASKFYYDSIVYDGDTLDFLVRKVGSSNIVLGSDYPFLAQQKNPVGFVKNAVNKQTAEAIWGLNAEKFLGLRSGAKTKTKLGVLSD